MTIKMNKEYTTIARANTIKEKMRDFKAYFTDADLLRMFVETVGEDIHGEIIKCTVEAFNANDYTDAASFYVQIIVDGIVDFHRVRFFIDEDKDTGTYAINPVGDLLTHEHFPMA